MPHGPRILSALIFHKPRSFPAAVKTNCPRNTQLERRTPDLFYFFLDLPGRFIESASVAAINFHPGSPEYPGTGCTNFAIYNDEKEYGITCHHMKAAVDSGHIIQVKRFPILPEDTVYSVTQQCYHLIEESFYEMMDHVLKGEPFPVTNEAWKRKPYTRKQLDDLCHIRPDMSSAEVERRIRATTYKTPWAFTRIGDHIFKLLAEQNQ